MGQKHAQQLTHPTEIDLEERVCVIVELWGAGDALDEDRIVEIAGNLYNVDSKRVREALIKNLLNGRIKAKFFIPSSR
jgi:hypothetical protein